MRHVPEWVLVFIAAAACTSPLRAAGATLLSCASIRNDAERLRCYDGIAQQERRGAREAQPGALPSAPATPAAGSWLETHWELRPELERGTLVLSPYRPLYLLAHYIRSPNERPSSPTRPAGSLPAVGIDAAEAKFQLSFKTKLAQNVFGGPGDLWFGYTQRSYWQLGNTRYSSPFRETNYEPEVMYIHPVNFELAGFAGRYVGLTLNHQSNGRDRPLSRSWNRLIAEAAVESGPWSIQLRPWTRLFSPGRDRNDNPDIEDYVGRGEAIVTYRANRHVFSLAARHTLHGGDASRGSAQFDWAFPLAGALNGHVQLFTGYGESLIDYNYRQTALGLGISFGD